MTIKKMYKKYLKLHKQNYETVLISEVLNDLYAIIRKTFKK